MITLFNMSITASFASVLVMGIRLFLQKMPKGYSYVLWLVVLFRFLCPFSFHSDFSLLPVYSEAMEKGIIYEEVPSIESGVFFVDRPVNQVLERTMRAEHQYVSVNPIQVAFFIALVVWELGMLIFFISHMVGYIRLKRRLETAIKIENGVYESDRITGAFVVGIFRPAIYLPCGLKEEERELILKHERVHIKRRDYLAKAFGFVMVMVHWFNPLAYVSFRLMCRDMEMACDESVLKELGEDGRRTYSLALLSAAELRSGISFPLAFRESHTKSRIKNILNYKKPAFWVSAAVVVLLAAAAFGLLTSPESPDGKTARQISIIGGADGPTSIFVAGKAGKDSPEAEEPEAGEPKAGERETEEPVSAEMPDSQWLAALEVQKSIPGETTGNELTLDFASDAQVIFHGAFGLFEFKLDGGEWKHEIYLEGETGAEFGRRMAELDGAGEDESGGVRREDIFRGDEASEGVRFIDYGVKKLSDGRIAVLGGVGDETGKGRLIDVFYGIYDADSMVMQQVYLFAGDGAAVENGVGEIEERRYLFHSEENDYFLRTPRTPLDFELGEGKYMRSEIFDRMELIRCSGGTTEVLDPLVSLQGLEKSNILLADGRLIYWGGADDSMLSFKSLSLISIKLDGTERKIARLDYNVCRGLSYDAPYLYYEGWTNAGEFPRPIYRMKPDFEEQMKIGEFDGILITVADGTFYMLDREKPAIVLTRRDRFGEKRYYDKCGYDAEHYLVISASVNDGKVNIRLADTDQWKMVDYEIEKAEDGWWE